MTSEDRLQKELKKFEHDVEKMLRNVINFADKLLNKLIKEQEENERKELSKKLELIENRLGDYGLSLNQFIDSHYLGPQARSLGYSIAEMKA